MENDVIDIIEGEFTHSIFKSDNYMVNRFKTDDGTIIVTGPFFEYERHQKYILSGKYIDHPRYGFQFSMLTIEKYLPSQKEEILSFLKSKAFKGIGKKTAEKIYEYFGNDTLNILKEDPSRINELNLTNKQLVSLQEGFENLNDPENEILFYLVSNGFNNNDAHKIFSRFKLATKEVANDNPFKFYNDIYGISFEKVKNFASKIEFEDSNNKYREAFLIFVLTEYTFNSGDIYVTYDDLIDYLNRYYGGIDNIDEIIDKAIDNHYIYIDGDKLYLYNDYKDEEFIGDYLKSFNSNEEIDEERFNYLIENVEDDLAINYDNKQKEAIYNFFSNNISLIVGGPGTGKTTIVRGMVEMFKEYYPYSHMIVVAPTGRAAKRINEICNCESKTIHSLLKWNKDTNTFAYDIDNPIIYDALIIDEFSMVDNSLFASLLKASRHVKKICIIGDDNQLPSIRPGNLLHDLIKSDIFVICKLNTNYRQSKGNEIISLASDIIDNNVDLSRYHNDIYYYHPKNNDFDLISLIKEDIDNGYSLDEIQVLTPMYKGNFGIDNLNALLQNTFNPRDINKNEKKVGNTIFRENDKILQLKNRPNDDVYNGDIGILEEINEKEKYLLVNYQGIYVFYQFDELQDITLAYAMSVHKAQGSEYQIVYFIISPNNINMLNKNLIYTAISRSKYKLVIIGSESLFKQGVTRNMRNRNTTLLERLL